ncbi:MAG: type IV secretion system protein [Methylococcaceae bacterium]|nr:type IV secretion system protein [Methylococcaceae bacterium]
MNFYTDFFNIINGTLETFISSTTSNVMNAVTPVATTMVSLTIILFGWAMMRGMIQMPLLDATSKALKIVIVFSLATNAGIHNEYITNFFWQCPDALANVVTGNNGSVSSINFLDELYTKFDTLANQFNQKGIAFSTIGASLSNIGISWMLWAVGGVLTLFAAGILLLSKIALSILLGLSPIFIIFIMFDATRKFFESWVGQVINFVFLPVLTATTISLVFSALDAFLQHIPAGEATQSQALAVCMVTGASIWILKQVPSMASALGGGVALSTLGAENWAAKKVGEITGGAARGAGKLTGRAAGAGYNAYNSRKNSISKD